MYTRRMTKAETEGEYEKETGRVIVESFDRLKPNYTPAGLVNNHGPFTWGKDAYEAVHNAVVLEQIAKMAAISLQINPNAKMNEALIKE